MDVRSKERVKVPAPGEEKLQEFPPPRSKLLYSLGKLFRLLEYMRHPW